MPTPRCAGRYPGHSPSANRGIRHSSACRAGSGASSGPNPAQQESDRTGRRAAQPTGPSDTRKKAGAKGLGCPRTRLVTDSGSLHAVRRKGGLAALSGTGIGTPAWCLYPLHCPLREGRTSFLSLPVRPDGGTFRRPPHRCASQGPACRWTNTRNLQRQVHRKWCTLIAPSSGGEGDPCNCAVGTPEPHSIKGGQAKGRSLTQSTWFIEPVQWHFAGACLAPKGMFRAQKRSEPSSGTRHPHLPRRSKKHSPAGRSSLSPLCRRRLPRQRPRRRPRRNRQAPRPRPVPERPARSG